MQAQGLPVLPHQEIALTRAGSVLDAIDRPAGRDLREALARAPDLAGGAQTQAGRADLARAMATERRVRHDPALRAERLVARWTRLEQAQAKAAGPASERLEAALDRLSQAIERDPAARDVMRARLRKLGIAPGSRLECRATLPVPRIDRPDRERERDRDRGR